MNHISVVYATEKDYGCTVISMLSVLESADADTFYDFYILVDDYFEDELKQNILENLTEYKMKCNIKFKKVGKIFDNVYLSLDFINKSTYYRLLIPEFLEEDKCIYLDSDTIICTDLQALFSTEMKENYIAGVKAPVYILREDEAHCKQALLPDIKQYVNAGVLLMNLKQMRKDNIIDKFMRLLPLKMESQDQDIINSACYGKIMFLSFEYNVMVKYASWTVSDYKGIFSEEELKRAWNNPGIIHYADRTKPWKNFNCTMGDYWWAVCKRSSMWDDFYKKMSDELLFGTIYSKNKRANAMITKSTIELFDLSYIKKVIIYGAGGRSVQFIKYLKAKGIRPAYVLVSSFINNPHSLEGIEVRELETIRNDIDGTIIIATMERYHMEILCILQKYKYKEIIPLSDTWKIPE